MNSEKYHLIRSFITRYSVLVSIWQDKENNEYICSYRLFGRKFVTNRYASLLGASDEAIADIYKKF